MRGDPFRVLCCRSIFAMTLLTGSTCWATSLVSGFNVVVFGDFTGQNSDLQGTLAVGGDLKLQNYALNELAARPNIVPGGFDTAVGGNLSLTNGSIYGPTFARSVSLSNVNSCGDCIATGLVPPLKFSDLYSEATQTSSYLYHLTPTGSAVFSFNNLYLTGSGASSVDVFEIDDSQISNASTIDITNVTPGAAIVINVAGSGPVATAKGQLQLNGAAVSKGNNILFNFASSITAISLNNGFDASMLAPTANVIGDYGEFNGDMVVASYTGFNQFEPNPFDGPLPSATPEPASFSLIAGTLLIGLLIRVARTL
jgi:choice-of-anchor A domain-containing protein